MRFEPKTYDYELSPYTGLTRESWVEAGKYLLEGIFHNIKDFQDPVVMPRKETEITYPHLWASQEIQATQRRAEVLEGLTRSFFIAAPLISHEPELEICGYSMREYYKNQILRACTRGDELYVGTYGDQQELTGHADPYRAFQQTVETCALVICLWVSKKQIWDCCTKAERDVVAEFLEGYAHDATVPQNWRLFNMLDMAFLNMEGYPIRKEVMRDHAQAILNYYAGDGWYRDGHSFDYYSCWAFNVYAPLWNLWYGYENEPYFAKKFEEHSNKLMETYGDFFDRDGWTNMWGRSNIYRNAATSAFEGNLLLRGAKADPGRARRISSGSLMQFLGREDFLHQGVPTLGFYGQFSPLVQGYSCAESPFWLGKAFLCLHLPADHPFWTAKENNGTWEELKPREVKVTCLNGPALCFSNHEANGETVLRTGKVVKGAGDVHGMWSYSKLCYNTKYPWEAGPQIPEDAPDEKGQRKDGPDEKARWKDGPEGKAHVKPAFGEENAGKAPPESGGMSGEENSGTEQEKLVESQQYVLRDHVSGRASRANVTFWHGERDGVLYRRQFFGYDLSKESHWVQAVNLADFPVSYGIVRVDRLRLFRGMVTLTLGAYGFPDNGTEVIWKTCGFAKAVVLKGRDAVGRERQMAMTVYDGWADLRLLHSRGTNPDSERSLLPYAVMRRQKQYGGFEPYVLISQVITKESHEDFAEEEIFPVSQVIYTDPEGCGSYGPVVLKLRDGTVKRVDYECMEGRLEL